jgi:hypothetical protein
LARSAQSQPASTSLLTAAHQRRRAGRGRRVQPGRARWRSHFSAGDGGYEGLSAGATSAHEDFDRYLAEHAIPKENHPAAFAIWIAKVTDGPVPRFEKVEREEPADGVVIEGDDL